MYVFHHYYINVDKWWPTLLKTICLLTHKLNISEQVDQDNFYSNIYTGQQSTWQCHMCTFRNHPLLNKCEECDMPRILVGTSPARTHDSGFGSFRDRNRKITQESKQQSSAVSDDYDELNNGVKEMLTLRYPS